MKKTISASVATTITTIAVASLAGSFLAPAFADTTDTNLAENASIQTYVTGIADSEFSSMELTYPGSLLGTTSWRGFCRQGGRDIIIKLPEASALDSISVQFEQALGSGVSFPTSVEFDVAENGSWINFGNAHSGIPLTDKKNTVYAFQVHLNHVAGQVIRIHFPIGVWVFARGLKVMGTATGSGNSNPEVPPLTQSGNNSPMSPATQRAAGIHNMLLVYTGGYGDQGTWSEDDFVPMLTYQPQNVSLQNQSSTSRMFDSMLFLPYGTVPDTQDGWEGYVQDLFTADQQLSALDAAVDKQNQAMDTPYFKENIVLTVPYLPYGTINWGNVNGQNINFAGSVTDPNGVSARVEAMNWELQTLMANWQKANFQHLHLTGIYWENEAFKYAAPGDTDFLKATISRVHQYGVPLFWIPFYGAENSFGWQQLGFDAAWLQPNYVEQGENADLARLKAAESEATNYGMGMELELNGLDPANGTLYDQSLQQFAEDGFGRNVSHAFYDGSKLLNYAANSTDPATRALYDNTFTFINNSN